MRTLCYLIILFFTIRAFAAEGLFVVNSQAPQVVGFVAPKTFMVLINTPTAAFHGSSVFVGIKKQATQTELYFLSNEHVLKNHCPTLGVCKDLYILQSPQLLYTGSQSLSLENPNDTVIFSTVEVVRQDKKQDLLLLRVVVKSETLPENIRTLELPATCPSSYFRETLYSVNFSDPTARPQPSQASLLPQPERILKRWSYGYFVGRETNHQISYFEGEVKKTERMTLLKTTVDALGGGSGGPIVNARGELVGLMMAVSGSHSLAIPCSTLKNFLSE